MEITDRTTPAVAWYLRILDNFRIPRPNPVPSVRDYEETWNVPASLRHLPPAAPIVKSGNLTRPGVEDPSPSSVRRFGTGPTKRRSDEEPILNSTRNKGCNKTWLLLLIPLIILVLAAIGVVLYFGLCHWGWSNMKCGAATVTPCATPCFNGGTCYPNSSTCICPPGIKTQDCSCNNVEACCGPLNINVTDNYWLGKTYLNSGLEKGYCSWTITPQSPYNNGSLLNMTVFVQFSASSSCDTDYVTVYNASLVNPDNLIANICQSSQNAYNFKSYLAPVFSIYWQITEPNQDLLLLFGRINYNYCDHQPCGPNATCVSQNDNYFCSCQPYQFGGGAGTPCRDPSICDAGTLCFHGCTCVDVNQTDYRCDCPPSYTGQNCQTHDKNQNNSFLYNK